MGKHTIDPQISAEHLAGAVRFATGSNADNSLTDYTKFDAFHEYLKETYPLVHKHLTLEHTGQARVGSIGRFPPLARWLQVLPATYLAWRCKVMVTL